MEHTMLLLSLPKNKNITTKLSYKSLNGYIRFVKYYRSNKKRNKLISTKITQKCKYFNSNLVALSHHRIRWCSLRGTGAVQAETRRARFRRAASGDVTPSVWFVSVCLSHRSIIGVRSNNVSCELMFPTFIFVSNVWCLTS